MAERFHALVRLSAGAASVALHLAPDSDRARHALTRGRGHRLRHVESVPDALADVVTRLARELGAASAAEPGPGTQDVLDELRALVPAPMTWRLWHAWPEHMAPRLPWTPEHAPPPMLSALGPGAPDVEHLALTLGLRRLIKREALWPADAERVAAHWRRDGLAVAQVSAHEPAGRVVLLAGSDGAVVAQAQTEEQALASGGARGDAAARWLGQALGYPDCCVAAFLRVSDRDDFSIDVCRVPPAPATPASFVAVSLNPYLKLVSHLSCAPDCAGTQALGARLYAALLQRDPEWADRWRELAARVHAVDENGAYWALAVDADARAPESLHVTDACEFFMDEHGAARHARRDTLIDARLVVDRGGWRRSDGDWRAVLAADHRAPEVARREPD